MTTEKYEDDDVYEQRFSDLKQYKPLLLVYVMLNGSPFGWNIDVSVEHVLDPHRHIASLSVVPSVWRHSVSSDRQMHGQAVLHSSFRIDM